MIRRIAAIALLLATSSCTREVRRTTPTFVVGHDGETFDQELALRRAVHGFDSWTLSLDERVRALCPGVGTTRSAIDWAVTRGELRGSLVRIAGCARAGALHDETITIVATSSVDDGVGQARAARIGEALVALGASADQIRIEVREGAPCDVRLGAAATHWTKANALR